MAGVKLCLEDTDRKPYPSDVSDDEWAFVAPYLSLMVEAAPQRRHDMREVYNAVRWIVGTGAQWRMLPTNFPPWAAVYQQTQRWIAAGCFEAMTHDLRVLIRWTEGRADNPSAVFLDGRTVQSTPESGGHAGCDGYKRRKGAYRGRYVGTSACGPCSPANEQECAQVGVLAEAVQAATGEHIELAFVDDGYTGRTAADAAAVHGIALEVVKLSEAKHGFVLLPRRWVVERSFAWLARFRRIARDDERLPETVRGLHFIAIAGLMVHPYVTIVLNSP